MLETAMHMHCLTAYCLLPDLCCLAPIPCYQSQRQGES